MTVQEPQKTIPKTLLISNGQGNDTQYHEIQLGEKTKSGQKCTAKFLIVVTEKDGEKQILPVGNMIEKNFDEVFIKDVLDKTRDKWIHVSRVRQNEKDVL